MKISFKNNEHVTTEEKLQVWKVSFQGSPLELFPVEGEGDWSSLHQGLFMREWKFKEAMSFNFNNCVSHRAFSRVTVDVLATYKNVKENVLHIPDVHMHYYVSFL